MVDWISTIVVGIVVVCGLLIFYKALREPIDFIGYHIKRGIIWVKEQIQGASSGGYKEVVTYG